MTKVELCKHISICSATATEAIFVVLFTEGFRIFYAIQDDAQHILRGNQFAWGGPLLALDYLDIHTNPLKEPSSIINDFNIVKCTAPPRRRPRINNSGTSGNIGVMTKLREEGWFDEAMEIVDKMDKQGMEITNNVLLCLLQEAIKRKDLKQGKELHRLTKAHNLESDTFLSTFLIRFYTTCGYLEEAIEAFSKVSEPDMSVYTWSAMILAHSRLGNAEDGLKIFDQMLQQSSLKPEENVFVAALEACATIPSLAEGQRVHKCIMEHNLATNVNIGCALIDMYTKCGNFDEARKVFERLPKRDLVVWNAMIATYSHFKRIPEALRLVQVLQQDRLKPNDVTFGAILKACSRPEDLESGKHIHAHIAQLQYDTNMAVASSLIEMYSRCGNVEGMNSVFHKLKLRDSNVWKSMISGFTHLGLASETVKGCVMQMQEQAVGLNEAFVPLLKAFHDASMFDDIRRIHACFLGGHKLDPVVGITLIEIYCKDKYFSDALAVFNKYTCKSLAMWTSVIIGYTQHGLGQDALLLLKQMLQEGTKPTQDIILCLLETCCNDADLNLGEQIHSHILDSSLKSNPRVLKSIADMYERCGKVTGAQRTDQIMSNA
ncbi:hypothetical protein KP509_39G013000 [Ceratopteris richardii]|uniref:Pentatricopeptide repeat-containing protein n=1 Tax=Ceratopteris richardii TaxID=49495 RepID=A0A8T2PYZ0_CERRI|nr:hypothetical protein KP509_39G013000 [Ceratopteris richardii]